MNGYLYNKMISNTFNLFRTGEKKRTKCRFYPFHSPNNKTNTENESTLLKRANV